MRIFAELPSAVRVEFGRLAKKHNLINRSNRVINTTPSGFDEIEYTFYHDKERIGRIALSYDMRNRVTSRSVVVYKYREDENGNNEEISSKIKERVGSKGSRVTDAGQPKSGVLE